VRLLVDHPFDRLLIAQALEESLSILTADKQFRRYGVPIVWATA
jgi:PIN domain nuclease of toxin-antitoxin system